MLTQVRAYAILHDIKIKIKILNCNASMDEFKFNGKNVNTVEFLYSLNEDNLRNYFNNFTVDVVNIILE